jgi:hypothetical protein
LTFILFPRKGGAGGGSFLTDPLPTVGILQSLSWVSFDALKPKPDSSRILAYLFQAKLVKGRVAKLVRYVVHLYIFFVSYIPQTGGHGWDGPLAGGGGRVAIGVSSATPRGWLIMIHATKDWHLRKWIKPNA